MMTADTITDEEIRDLRNSSRDYTIDVMCRVALNQVVRNGKPLPADVVIVARQDCANVINSRNARMHPLREAADRFHKILSSYGARRLLAKDKVNAVIRQSMEEQLLDEDAIDRLAIEGFEACVRALAVLGDPTVTIHECNPSEEPLP